jgi:hypothetical protein
MRSAATSNARARARLLALPLALSAVLVAASCGGMPHRKKSCSPLGFTPARLPTFAGGAGPTSAVADDFNGDAQIDLAVANWAANTVSVFLGNGSGVFTPAPTSPFTVGKGPVQLVAGDFNEDEILDLAVTSTGSGTISVLINDGSAGFFPAVGSPLKVPPGASSDPQTLAAGDFSGDGHLDLATALERSKGLYLFVGDGTGAFAPALASAPGVAASARSLAAGDFNGDRRPDLALANPDADQAQILLGSDSGRFAFASGSPLAVGTSPWATAPADFNGDGRLDLAVANRGGASVSVFLGDGKGGFARAPHSPLAAGQLPSALAASDLNGDGHPDLVVANTGSRTLSVFLGTGEGSFRSDPPIRLKLAPSLVSIGDFNDDGRPDLAAMAGPPLPGQAYPSGKNAAVLLARCG